MTTEKSVDSWEKVKTRTSRLIIKVKSVEFYIEYTVAKKIKLMVANDDKKWKNKRKYRVSCK